MKIFELAKLNKTNGGHFFDRAAMRMFRETKRTLRIRKGDTKGTVIVTRPSDNRESVFNATTGRLINSKNIVKA